ncbi:hypothetical protein OG241_33110 [Streptomyces sp. NBC_01390]|uniref:hypothetical protein n=1 Tax=Streptomyces sp. NBC_01390 TaxID=2903850 RepID=UPI00324E44A1
MTRKRSSYPVPVSSCSATNAATPGGTSAGTDKKVSQHLGGASLHRPVQPVMRPALGPGLFQGHYVQPENPSSC